MITKYCGKEEKLLLRSNFSSFPQYFQYLKLKYICSPITYLFMKCGCSIYYFFNSANLICRGTDISKYLIESLGLPDQESRLFLYDGVCLFVFFCFFFLFFFLLLLLLFLFFFFFFFVFFFFFFFFFCFFFICFFFFFFFFVVVVVVFIFVFFLCCTFAIRSYFSITLLSGNH